MANFSVIFRQTRHIEDGNDQLNYHFAEGMDCLQTYEVDAQSEEEAITKAKVELEAAGWERSGDLPVPAPKTINGHSKKVWNLSQS